MTPSKHVLTGLDGQSHEIGDGSQYATAIVTDPWIIDYQTNSLRRPCLEDILRNGRSILP